MVINLCACGREFNARSKSVLKCKRCKAKGVSIHKKILKLKEKAKEIKSMKSCHLSMITD